MTDCADPASLTEQGDATQDATSAPDNTGLLPLQIWLSPAFPVGAFAYSHGIETSVNLGDIHDAGSLRAWLEDLLSCGSLHNDLVLVTAAYRAAARHDWRSLIEVNELAVALAPSRERHLETTAQGNAFVMAARASWPCASLDRLAGDGADVAYPVALAAAAASHGLPLNATLKAYALAFVSNLVSGAVRLGPIGQTDGQRTIAAILPLVARCAEHAARRTLDDLGSAALRSDIAAMRHETLYSRLFRS